MISLGSLEDVVFMLHVKRSERGFTSPLLVDGVAEMTWESAIRGDPLRTAMVTGQVLLAELVIVV